VNTLPPTLRGKGETTGKWGNVEKWRGNGGGMEWGWRGDGGGRRERVDERWL